MQNNLDIFEDKERIGKKSDEKKNIYSKYCDLIYYNSTHDPELTLAMLVYKPDKPSYIKAATHGWHMSIKEFHPLDKPQGEYLTVQIDMRGRAFSDGSADCNGWELYDIIDGIEYVKKHYKEYIIDEKVVYFEAGSGGGGNAYALACKFPDYFAHITSMCGISDYELWYKNDSIGEFRDELDVWIGDFENKEAYASRSGITAVENICTYMSVIHGTTDLRVGIEQARGFMEKAYKTDKYNYISYMELPGVGTREHWGNTTDEQMDSISLFPEAARKAHRVPVNIPRKGKMVICGYLFTKDFSVVLNNIDRVAHVEYDLDRNIINVIGLNNDEFTIKAYDR